MTDRRAEHMRRLNKDPDFAAARDERGRERLSDPDENRRLQRLSNIAQRGCDVPEWKEEAWRALKQKRVPNREAANMLSIPWLGDPEDEQDVTHKFVTVDRIADEQIEKMERLIFAGRLDPDDAYDLIEMAKRQKRVVVWNTSAERRNG